MSVLYKIEDLAQQAFNLLPQAKPTLEQLQQCRLVAHRGAHNNLSVIENSYESFELCLKNNIWGIEFDLRFTSDLTPLIHHDEHLGRFFQRPDLLISEITASNATKQFPQLPELSQIVTDFGKKMHFMIEIKEHLSQQQTKVLKSILSPLAPVDDYHFLYLDPALATPIDFAPPEANILVGELNILKMSSIASNTAQWGGVAGPYMLLNRQRIHSHQQQKQKVGTGYANTPNLLFYELRRGVDWVFTNQALQMQEVLDLHTNSSI